MGEMIVKTPLADFRSFFERRFKAVPRDSAPGRSCEGLWPAPNRATLKTVRAFAA